MPDQVRTAHVEVGKICRVGFVDIVIDFEQRDVRFGLDGVEELVWRVSVVRADEEMRHHGIEDAELGVRVLAKLA